MKVYGLATKLTINEVFISQLTIDAPVLLIIQKKILKAKIE